MVIKKFISLLVLTLVIFSCQNENKRALQSPNKDFAISFEGICVDATKLGLVEGLSCVNTDMVVLDFKSGMSYSLFDVNSGSLLKRFGQIGKGNGEIPKGSVGYLTDSVFYAFSEDTHEIMKFRLQSKDTNERYTQKHSYDVSDLQITKIIPIDNSLYVGMGTYKDRYQYVLFNEKDQVVDYQFEIYNANDKTFDTYQKFLSNQGLLVKHPQKNIFAGAVFHSSNIDFFSIDDNKIKEIKTIRQKNPKYEGKSIMGLSQVIPTKDAINGYIDMCASDEYVFAIFSENTLKDNPYASKQVLVFNWKGEQVGKINFKNNVFYIAANNKYLFTAEKQTDGLFIINKYKLP